MNLRSVLLALSLSLGLLCLGSSVNPADAAATASAKVLGTWKLDPPRQMKIVQLAFAGTPEAKATLKEMKLTPDESALADEGRAAKKNPDAPESRQLIESLRIFEKMFVVVTRDSMTLQKPDGSADVNKYTLVKDGANEVTVETTDPKDKSKEIATWKFSNDDSVTIEVINKKREILSLHRVR
jgi:hypothetical protein